MKKIIQKIVNAFLSALPHINITLSIVLLVLFVTDRYNRAMAFINNDIAKWMLCILCVTSFLQAVIYAYHRRRAIREKEKDD